VIINDHLFSYVSPLVLFTTTVAIGSIAYA
jgi:hypothetical protein